ncbi:MAG: AmpG family muropeptide MFS transporter [Bdellovibrio sp.]|nr:MAG: AmpG family muropeptide MFS transporter [Bdellovibrio sp.]
MGKLKLLYDKKMLTVFALGFSSGLPLLLTAGTLQAWFKDSGMNIAEIGLFALVQIPYTMKFVWSPVLDWFVPPFLGRRRGWLLIAQVGLMVALTGLSLMDPKEGYAGVAFFALAVAFLSATQDIGVDAYIIESLPRETYGLGSQVFVLAYRLAMLTSFSGSMILADHFPWRSVYMIMAATLGVGVVTTLLSPEPVAQGTPPRKFVEAVWHPIRDFFSSTGPLRGKALWILSFFVLYKVGGDLATALTTPFYLELGYSKTEIGAVAKAFSLWATIIGGIFGGGVVVYIGVRRALWIFGILQAVAYLAFAWLGYFIKASGTTSLVALAGAVTVENLAAGLATAAYTAFMGSVVNRKFTATQYALLSSLMGMTRVYSAVPAGFLIQNLGWIAFFVFCSAAALPGLFVLAKIDRLIRSEGLVVNRIDHSVAEQ